MNRLFFTLLIFCTVSCYSQVSVSLKELSGTKWKIVDTEDELILHITEYSNSYRKTTTTFKTIGRKSSVQNKYYLSDYIPSSFEHSRVGKSTRGKYIISYNSVLNTFAYVVIKQFDSKRGMMVIHRPARSGVTPGDIPYQKIK